METWLIWALLSVVASGLFSFGLKVVVEKGYIPEVTIFYSSILGGAFLLVPVFANGVTLSHLGFISLLALVNGLAYYFAVTMRVTTLRYIHTTIYFPIYKTFGPILATMVGLWFFRDTLTSLEWLGIVVGVLVPLLLISRAEDAIQQNLKKGIMLIILAAPLSIIAAVPTKIVHSAVGSVDEYVFLALFFQGCIALVSAVKKKQSLTIRRQALLFALALGFMNALGVFAFTAAMLEGDFSVVFTINAFSILVPIVLSILIFKEHMNLRKGIVIGLSIVSVIFFAL